ncbi:MAG: hypothetical protein SFU86_15725 [Pirellulaceae bacterium]|nr:hypothetical protein [Pirellulaceae bacterium]
MLVLLAGAVWLQDLVWLAVIEVTEGRWPATPGIVAMGLVLTQLGVALALVWMNGYLLVRGVGFLVNLGLAGLLAAAAMNHHFGNWLGLVSLFSAVAAIPFVGVRLAGGALLLPEDLPVSRWPKLQFTIWGLISLTTLVAAGLGVARFVEFPWVQLGAAGLFALAAGLVPWIALPLVLSRAHGWLPIVATLIVAPLAGWLMASSGFPPEMHQRELIALSLLHAGLTLALAWVVRIAGYRLKWPG